nr:unnamed protein product [Digitaria exilis]
MSSSLITEGASSSMEKRRKTKTPTNAGGCAASDGVDLISGLVDDVLVRILELLPDARDVVRTHALSRRWRGLWTRVTDLCFDSNGSLGFKESGDPERFVCFVDDALALRAAEKEPAGVEHLAIFFDISKHGQESEQLMPPCVQAAQGWIHYAVQQHPVKSLVFHLDLPWYYINDGGHEVFIKNPAMNLNGLASSAKLETMDLQLSDVKLQLPSSAVFASLTDLSLGAIEVEAGGGHLLARLVSSACCPRLRSLQLVDLTVPGMEGPLLIDADALMELTLEIGDLRILELRTPSLRVLRIKECYQLEGLTISAPRLHDLEFVIQHPLHIDKDVGLSSVERLKIQLMWSHGYLFDGRNDGTIRLLDCCRLNRYLEVCLQVPKREKKYVDIIKSWIPQLPHVTSLAIDIMLWSRRSSYTAGIASLLAQCNNIRHLSLQLFSLIEKVSQKFWMNSV